MKAKKCLLVVLCVVVALAIAFLVYVNQYYQKCRKAPAFRHGDIRHTLSKVP